VSEHIELLHRDGFKGIAPLPVSGKLGDIKPAYLTDEYFTIYGHMLDELSKYRMELIFYDDVNFPTGTANGKFGRLYPDKRIKYLERIDTVLTGGDLKTIPVPDGKLMSACLSESGSSDLKVITSDVRLHKAENGISKAVISDLPEGKWRLQLFFCCVDDRRDIVDYLDPDAVSKLLTLTYEKYYERLPEHFGTTIKTTFYDDHSYFYTPNSATWTDRFNDGFRAKYGFEPDALYPSLFENTGGYDAANRAYLFAFRDELNAKGYPAVVSEWAARHKMVCSGHPAATYRPNPLQNMGDGLYYFKYQDVPLCDYIHYFRHGIDGFNIPASAAYNFDKDTLICELYGNFKPDTYNDSLMLYRAGMDVYARGINLLLPHGTWYNDRKMTIVPEISWRNPKMKGALKNYNHWVARCEMVLRQSRHVAQVGILYPIADLRSRYNFLDYKVTNGRESIRGNDYFDFIGLMTKKMRTDYTLLHPETLDERCVVKPDAILRLDNKRNFEEYNLLIVPWCRTIHASNMLKIKEYVMQGGIVLFTGYYPEQAAEFSMDEEIKEIVAELKGCSTVHFIETPDEINMRSFLDTYLDPLVKVEDVRIIKESLRSDLPASFRDPDCSYNCIHKVKDGKNFYFFGNPTDHDLTATISFKANDICRPELWDPHTGKIEAIPFEMHSGRAVITLPLEAVRSRFVVF
jgi:hypothetical protein